MGKTTVVRLNTQWIFTDDGPVFRYAVGKSGVFGRINDVQSINEYCMVRPPLSVVARWEIPSTPLARAADDGDAAFG